MKDFNRPPVPITIRAPDGPNVVTFFDKDLNEVGRLEMHEGKLTFKGNVDASAREFFDAVCKLWGIQDPRPDPRDEDVQ